MHLLTGYISHGGMGGGGGDDDYDANMTSLSSCELRAAVARMRMRLKLFPLQAECTPLTKGCQLLQNERF